MPEVQVSIAWPEMTMTHRDSTDGVMADCHPLGILLTSMLDSMPRATETNERRSKVRIPLFDFMKVLLGKLAGPGSRVLQIKFR